MSPCIFHSNGTVDPDDRWRIVSESQRPAVNDKPLWSLPLLLAQTPESDDHRPVGVWLAPTDDPSQLLPWLDRLSLIAIEFPKLVDGRGYSLAALLRTRHGYRGELRAVGEVAIDQLCFLHRVGFNSFALRADQDVATAAASLKTYSDAYQGAAIEPLPAYRRHRRPALAVAS